MMDKQALLEKAAMIAGVAIVLGGVWFWALQIGDVIELLEMAYG